MSINQQTRLFPPAKFIYALLFIIILSAAYQIHQYWPELLRLSISWQRKLNHYLTELLQASQTDPLRSGSLLIAISFLYGLLHALGPGHGKLIITTYIATHPTFLRQSVFLSLLASLLQGLVAIVLVSSILILFQLSTKHLHLVSQYSEKLSYAVVIALGLFCCLKAFRQLWRMNKQRRVPARQIRSISTLNPPKMSVMKPKLPTETVELCQCGHQHVVPAQQLPNGIKTQALVVLSMGLRPCSGALLVLLFSYVIGVYQWGIAAAMAMAIGTALTICTIAFFVYFLRDIAVRLAQKRRFSFSPYWGIAIGLCAGLIFILLGLLMFQSLSVGEMGSPLLSPRRS